MTKFKWAAERKSSTIFFFSLSFVLLTRLKEQLSDPSGCQGMTLTILFYVKAKPNPRGLIRGGAEFWLSKERSSFKAQWECSTPNESLAAIRCTSQPHRVQPGQGWSWTQKKLHPASMSTYYRAKLISQLIIYDVNSSENFTNPWFQLLKHEYLEVFFFSFMCYMYVNNYHNFIIKQLTKELMFRLIIKITNLFVLIPASLLF